MCVQPSTTIYIMCSTHFRQKCQKRGLRHSEQVTCGRCRPGIRLEVPTCSHQDPQQMFCLVGAVHSEEGVGMADVEYERERESIRAKAR